MKKVVLRNLVRLCLPSILILSLVQGVNAQTKDTTPPSDVEHVIAVPGDKKVTLSWDPSEDNVGVTGYKVYFGTETVDKEGKQYNLGFIEVGNVITYDVTGLENGTTYYFALTAVDTEKNESVKYSFEVKATPAAEASVEDKTAPRVTKASSLGNTSVKIEFSEKVVLPKTAPENAFVLKETTSGKSLEIISARIDASNQANVILSTEPQTKDIDYTLTVGIGVEDEAGNPIVSGISDTAVFKGQGASEDTTPDEPEDNTEPEDKTAPEIMNVEAVATDKVKITFSEDLKLDQTPQDNFRIYQKDNASDVIDVASATTDVQDPALVILETETMIGGRTYVVEVTGVSDESGNVIIQDNRQNQATFEAMTTNIADLIPPEDVTKLIATLQEMTVRLSWTASVNTAGDLADQILYMSTDKGTTYDKGRSLGSTTTSYDVKDLKINTEYTFKLTVKDKSGNESKGVITSIYLPETGPGLIGLLALGSIGVGFWVGRKRKN